MYDLDKLSKETYNLKKLSLSLEMKISSFHLSLSSRDPQPSACHTLFTFLYLCLASEFYLIVSVMNNGEWQNQVNV